MSKSVTSMSSVFSANPMLKRINLNFKAPLKKGGTVKNPSVTSTSMRVAIDLADQHQEPPTAKQFIRGHSRSASKITLKVSASRADMIYVPPEDRRAEPRNKSRGRFQLLVDGAEPLATTAYNTSPSGICLEAFAPVETGTAVRVDGEGVHCARGGPLLQ